MRELAALVLVAFGCGGGGGNNSPDLAMPGGPGGSPWVGSYACNGSQTQVCDGAHLGNGTYATTASCPQALTVSGSTLTSTHASGTVFTYNITDATHATLATPVSLPDFTNPVNGIGTIHNYTISTSTLTLSATLDESDSGTFQWVHTTGMENCTFTRTFSGPLPH
jgi:hypothetical protein